MLQNIVKDLMLWFHGMFVELLSFCANALLDVMNMDLAYFESNVPVVTTFYKTMVAIGWGLLIGNCIFQCLKAMFAGLGFETESPGILLLRTFLFGFLLFFSYSVCDIVLSVGKKAMELIGMPARVEIAMPTESEFSSLDVSWLLVIIIGFLIGIQIFKLFFEIAERYAVVAILVLFSPLAFAMGGSRSTKDIFSGYIRTLASMLLLLFSNVIFLKLVFSALGSMPSGVMVLPWALLVIGIARTAKKADTLLGKIGMNPQFTGDPLGNGSGKFLAMMAARTAISSAMHSGNHYGRNRNGNGTNNAVSGTNGRDGGNPRTPNGNRDGRKNGGNGGRNPGGNRSNPSSENKQNHSNNASNTRNQSYHGTQNTNSQHNGGGKNGGTKGGGSSGSGNRPGGGTTKKGGKNHPGNPKGNAQDGGKRPNPPGGTKTGKQNSAKGNGGSGQSKKNPNFEGVSHNRDQNFKTFGKVDTVHTSSNAFSRFGAGARPEDRPAETEEKTDG